VVVLGSKFFGGLNKMELKERIIKKQELTGDYFLTAELLNISYSEVRSVCEERMIKTIQQAKKFLEEGGINKNDIWKRRSIY
jgi:hypothetical protein